VGTWQNGVLRAGRAVCGRCSSRRTCRWAGAGGPSAGGVMVSGYSRMIAAVMIPSRAAPDLLAGHWHLISGQARRVYGGAAGSLPGSQRVTGPAQHKHHVRGPISQGRVVFAISRPGGATASRGCPAPGRSEPALGDDEPAVIGAAHDDDASRCTARSSGSFRPVSVRTWFVEQKPAVGCRPVRQSGSRGPSDGVLCPRVSR
jgi:hypothetical protein